MRARLLSGTLFARRECFSCTRGIDVDSEITEPSFEHLSSLMTEFDCVSACDLCRRLTASIAFVLRLPLSRGSSFIILGYECITLCKFLVAALFPSTV